MTSPSRATVKLSDSDDENTPLTNYFAKFQAGKNKPM